MKIIAKRKAIIKMDEKNIIKTKNLFIFMFGVVFISFLFSLNFISAFGYDSPNDVGFGYDTVIVAGVSGNETSNVSYLNDILDVSVGSPIDDTFLYWNSTNGLWEAKAVGAGSSIWQRALGIISPINIADDLNLSGTFYVNVTSGNTGFGVVPTAAGHLLQIKSGESIGSSGNTNSKILFSDTDVQLRAGDNLKFYTSGIERGRFGDTSGQFSVGDGAQATPSYSFTNDLDTGLYSTANNIHFTTGANLRMTIDEFGQLGIGLQNPLATLHIKVGDPDIIIQNTNGVAAERYSYIYFADNTISDAHTQLKSTRTSGSKTGGGAFTISTQNTSGTTVDAFHIDSSQNVGIGTSTPGTLLDVNGSATIQDLNSVSCDVKSYTNGTLYCGTDATGGGSGAGEFIVDVTSSSGNVTYTTPTQYTNNIISFIINSTTPGTTFYFQANENSSGIMLDTSRKLHTGEWYITKNIATIGENVTMKIFGASADELFTMRFTYD